MCYSLQHLPDRTSRDQSGLSGMQEFEYMTGPVPSLLGQSIIDMACTAMQIDAGTG